MSNLQKKAIQHISTQEANEKERRTGKRGWINRKGWSGGEENERQMANNVMWEIGIVMGTWYCWLACMSLPGNGARNSSCYLLSTALVFPEEEGMMQQSSISISLSFREPMYQSSRRLRSSPSYLHKNNSSMQPMRLGVVNPFTVTYESEIW